MEILKHIKAYVGPKKYLILSFVFAFANALFLLLFYIPAKHFSDTDVYVSTIKSLSGDPSVLLSKTALIKPFYMVIGTLFHSFLDPEKSLILQNIIFYFLSALLIFLIVRKIYNNERQSFYSVVLYSAAYPMLAYGLAAIIDTGGWFFYLLCIWLSLALIKNVNLKRVFLIGIIAGLGMLFKESVAAFPIFFFSFTALVLNIAPREKIKTFCIFSAGFFIPIIISNLIIYKLFSYSMFGDFLISWQTVADNHPKGSFYSYSFFRIAIEIARVFFLGWIFVVLGAIKEYKEKNKERYKFILALILPSLSFLLWSFPHNRMAFISAPLIVLLGSFGLIRTGKNTKMNIFIELSCLVLYVAVNYFFLVFLLSYGEGLRNILI